MKFKQKESYKHLLAKNLLGTWLADEDAINKFCQIAQFSWVSNYGVFEELKFYETSSPYYFENSKGVMPDLDNDNYLEWFDKSIYLGKILFVPDITVFHKGAPLYLFEIVHTNGLSGRKIRNIRHFFKNNYVEVFEVKASEILKHDSFKGVPSFIKCNKVI